MLSPTYCGRVARVSIFIDFTVSFPFKGVSVALLSGMAMTLWISFGGPRPPIAKLPLHVDGCGFNVTVTPIAPYNPSDYFYLYRVSYMWTSLVSIYHCHPITFSTRECNTGIAGSRRI